MAFGGESPLFIAALRVVARTRPDWPMPRGSRVRSYNVAGGLRQMRHSMFYGNDAILLDLAQWIVFPPPNEPVYATMAEQPSPEGGVLADWSYLIALISTFVLAWYAYADPQGFEALNARMGLR